MHDAVAEAGGVKLGVGRRVIQVMIVAVLLCGLQGCAAVALTLLSAGASAGIEQGLLFRDKATAGEIIARTEQAVAAGGASTAPPERSSPTR